MKVKHVHKNIFANACSHLVMETLEKNMKLA